MIFSIEGFINFISLHSTLISTFFYENCNGIDHRDNEVICCYVALNTGGDPDPHPRYIKSLVELEEALAYALKWLETAP